MINSAPCAAQALSTEPVIAYIGLGSNLQQPVAQLHAARASIVAHTEIEERYFSSLYQSPPMGPQDQPDYVNAVMAISTTLNPLDLLSFLQRIENHQGRVRQEQRWVARTLDLDILLYAQQCINLPHLIIPHIGLAERAFVLYPLYEIAPELVIPGKGLLAHLVEHCPRNGLIRIAERD